MKLINKSGNENLKTKRKKKQIQHLLRDQLKILIYVSLSNNNNVKLKFVRIFGKFYSKMPDFITYYFVTL